MTNENNFPVYRKYPGSKTYFKVHSFESFEEVKTMGGFYLIHHYKAEKLPDRNLIEDLVNGKDQYYEVITEEEFEDFKAYCRENLQPLQ